MKKFLLLWIVVSLGMTSIFAQDTPLLMIEDWESGDFSMMQWERVGTRSLWEVTSEGAPARRCQNPFRSDHLTLTLNH